MPILENMQNNSDIYFWWDTIQPIINYELIGEPNLTVCVGGGGGRSETESLFFFFSSLNTFYCGKS